MSATNQWPLPEGVKLEEGALYGLRKPEFQGDEAAILPFSMLRHGGSPDTVVIKATGPRSYHIHHVNPATTSELGEVQGLLPSMFPTDGEVQEQRQRRGGPMQHELNPAHHFENDYHEGLINKPEQATGTGLMADTQGPPASAELAPPAVPDSGLMAGLGAPPTPPTAATGKAKGKSAKTPAAPVI